MAAKRKTTTKKVTARKQAPSKKAPSKPAAGGKTTIGAKTTDGGRTTDGGMTTANKAPQKMSALDAAAKVLSESKEPMRSGEMIEQMAAKGYWKSPGGKTPEATLSAAIAREINTKGQDARFKKTGRGLFAANT